MNKTREEVARFIEAQFDSEETPPGKGAGHYGRVELMLLMDFLFGGPPNEPEDNLFRGTRDRAEFERTVEKRGWTRGTVCAMLERDGAKYGNQSLWRLIPSE